MKIAVFAGVLGVLVGLPLAAASASAKNVTSPAPVPAEPQQTSASFGDWVVRCVSAPAPAKTRVCEASQSVVVQGQQSPIAQIAFANTDRQETVTILVPTNIAFDKPPQIGTDEANMATLAFRRCISAGCLAAGQIESSMLTDMRDASKPGRLVFTDAGERSIALPISFRGLAQALNDLTREK